MLLGGNEVKTVCAGLKVDQFRPNIDLEFGERGGGKHLKSENMYWTETKASVPKEFVRDCGYQRNDKLKHTVGKRQRRRTKKP